MVKILVKQKPVLATDFLRFRNIVVGFF